jgi:hypothetical protein
VRCGERDEDKEERGLKKGKAVDSQRAGYQRGMRRGRRARERRWEK